MKTALSILIPRHFLVNRPDVYLSEEVRAVRSLHKELFTETFRKLPIRAQLDAQANTLVDAHKTGNRAVATHVTCWPPALVGHSADEIMAHQFTLSDARETIAREYGFRDWQDVEKRGTAVPDEPFEAAVDALLDGDVETLKKLLRERPSLADQVSDYGHRATLLHYAGSNGIETYRQVVPKNLADAIRVLLDAGADVNAEAEIYGGGCTTIALVITSSHPTEAGVVDQLVQVLLDAGAITDQS